MMTATAGCVLVVLLVPSFAYATDDQQPERDFREHFDAAALPDALVVRADDPGLVAAAWFAYAPDPCAPCVRRCKEYDERSLGELDEFAAQRCRGHVSRNRSIAQKWLRERKVRFSAVAKLKPFDLKKHRFAVVFPVEFDLYGKERPGSLGDVGPFAVFVGKPVVEGLPVERGEHRGIPVTAQGRALRGVATTVWSRTLDATQAERSPLRSEQLCVEVVVRLDATGISNIAPNARMHRVALNGGDISVKGDDEWVPWLSAVVLEYRVLAGSEDVTALFEPIAR